MRLIKYYKLKYRCLNCNSTLEIQKEGRERERTFKKINKIKAVE